MTCSRLNDGGKSFVPFIGIYSTRDHPFALVFKFMDHLNLRGYLGDNKNVGRLELVRSHRHICNLLLSHPRDQLLEIARGLRYMHGLGIVHGNLKMVRPSSHSELDHALISV